MTGSVLDSLLRFAAPLLPIIGVLTLGVLIIEGGGALLTAIAEHHRRRRFRRSKL